MPESHLLGKGCAIEFKQAKHGLRSALIRLGLGSDFVVKDILILKGLLTPKMLCYLSFGFVNGSLWFTKYLLNVHDWVQIDKNA